MAPEHEGVVRVSGLPAQARPGRRAGHGVLDPAPSPDQAPSGRLSPERQVGVLPIGAGKRLFEASERRERGPPVGDVGGGPEGVFETLDLPLPIRGTAP